MVHVHRPLRQRMQRECALVDLVHVRTGAYQNGSGIEIGLDARAMRLGRLDGAVAVGGEAELLQRLG